MYFSSAGNEGNLDNGTSGTWQGDFSDGGAASATVGGAGRVHLFSAGAPSNQIITAGSSVSLYWADPLGASANDYDLYILDSSGTNVVGASTNLQNGTQDPYETVGGSAVAAGNLVVVVKKTGAARFLYVGNYDGTMAIATSGQILGHNGSRSSLSVSATPASVAFGQTGSPTGPYPNPFSATNSVEVFTSDGPRHIFFNADSSAITSGNFSSSGGQVLQKPDFTAADGVAVTGNGGFGPRFYGTSAAAPHAAAIAALVKASNPGITNATVIAALRSSAIDILAAGWDQDAGFGILSPYDAIVAAATPGFVSLVPSRILDTRSNGSTSDGQFAAGGVVAAGQQVDLNVLGRGGVPASGVTTVVLNVTATDPTAAGYVTVWPSTSPRPNASNPNLLPAQTIPNLVVVKVGTSGKVSLYNALGSTDLIADVVGYFTTTSALTPLVPARLLDTRAGQATIDGQFSGAGASGPFSQFDLTVAGRGGLPTSGVGAVILNVTATDPTAAGYITVWPSDATRPFASNLNFTPGLTIPNLVITKVSATGTVSLFNSAGTTDLIADVIGWFPTTSELTALVPARLLDTRSGGTTTDGQFAGGGALGAYTLRNFTVTGRGNVPSTGVGSVILNVTVTDPTATGYLTVWPTGSTQPLASNLNFVPGQTIPNLVIAKVGTNGQVSLFNSAGNSDVIADVVGWFP